jgi:hypothetical protein
MKKGKPVERKDSAEQVSSDEAIKRMERFIDRKERFVDAVKKGKDRSVSAR